MKILRATLLVTLLCAFVSASLLAQKVNTDYDKKADFSHYKTYMWIHEPKLRDPLMTQRLKEDVESELNAKGWQEVKDNADVGIAAHAATQQQQTLNTFYDGFPGGWRWNWGGESTTEVDHYTVGTIVIDLFDTHTKQAIFRGVATDTISDKPEKNAENIKKAVDKMFKKFPPEKG